MADSTSLFIAGVHFFCDHCCWRCPLAARCRVHARWSSTPEPARLRAHPTERVAAIVKMAMEVTIEDVAAMLDRGELVASADEHTISGFEAAADRQSRAALATPLNREARAYAKESWPRLRALRTQWLRSGDAVGVQACDRLEEVCISIASKIFRALSSAAAPDYDPTDVASDSNGAAKVALLLIEDSRQAWRVVRQRPQAADAAAGFLARLDRLEAGLLQRFPQAFAFVRPGFDTGDLPGAGGEVARAMLLAAQPRAVRH
jgi:hypothetical protein